jgi:hypothetical protein
VFEGSILSQQHKAIDAHRPPANQEINLPQDHGHPLHVPLEDMEDFE